MNDGTFAARGGVDTSDPPRLMVGNSGLKATGPYYKVRVNSEDGADSYNYNPYSTPGPNCKAFKFFCFGFARRHAIAARWKHNVDATVWMCDSNGVRLVEVFGENANNVRPVDAVGVGWRSKDLLKGKLNA